ncbi:MAG: hypothetical protein Kilf2KO_06840 [Rhodospirillales bacterium]
MPLHLLITRPQPQAAHFAALLEAAGHRALVAPLLTIVPKPPPAASLFVGIDAVAVTSAKALTVLAPPPDVLRLPLFAVGEASASAARAAGFQAVEAAGGDAEDLSSLLRRRLSKGSRILHPHGVHRSRDLGTLLAGSGLTVIGYNAYKAEAAAHLPAEAAGALSEGSLDGVTFFSPRTAETFVRLLSDSGLEAALQRLVAICLSPAVAAGLDRSSWRAVRVAPQPTAAALLNEIESLSCGGGRA